MLTFWLIPNHVFLKATFVSVRKFQFKARFVVQTTCIFYCVKINFPFHGFTLFSFHYIFWTDNMLLFFITMISLTYRVIWVWFHIKNIFSFLTTSNSGSNWLAKRWRHTAAGDCLNMASQTLGRDDSLRNSLWTSTFCCQRFSRCFIFVITDALVYPCYELLRKFDLLCCYKRQVMGSWMCYKFVSVVKYANHTCL